MKRIVCVGDIHIGSQKTEILNNQLDNILYPFLKDFKPDLVVNLGDTSHYKLMLNSNDSVLYIDLGYKLKELSKNVLIVGGTLSHDMAQFRIYNNLIDKNFRVIYQADNILLSDLNILVLPEEYDLPLDYYDKFFNKHVKYDFVFGHGMFDFVSFVPKKLLNIVNSKHARVWKTDEFKNILYGLCVFGHIHIRSEKSNIMYPGSFSRFSFGEDEDKGFLAIEYDENKKKIIKKEFIKNTLAPSYKDIFTNDLLKLSKDTDKMLKYLREIAENNFKYRVVINTPNLDEGIRNNIDGFIKQTENGSIIKKLPKESMLLELSDTKKIEKQKLINEKVEKFNNLDFYELTKLYAKEEMKREIDNNFIDKCLNE